MSEEKENLLDEQTGSTNSNNGGDLKAKAASGFSWSILIQLSHQVLNFVVSILLARLLLPADFGKVGIIMIFMSLGRILLDGGLAPSLIRTKDVDQKDYSTVFIINVCAAIIAYLTLFVFAPYITSYFKQSADFTSLLRVYGIVLILGSLTIVQSVRLNKNLQFKTQFKLLLPSIIISGAAAIWMAYHGFGVWSLVYKEIIFSSLAGIQLWYYSKWTPSLVFSKEKFLHHFRFSYKLLLNDLLYRVFNDTYKFLIGRFYSPTELGLYTRAKSMEELPNGVIFNAINRVMFPLLAQVNDDNERLKRVYSMIISRVAFILVPTFVMLGIMAKPIFIFLLTEKWLQSASYFQVLMFGSIFLPINAYNINICKVKGRSDIVLKMSILELSLIAIGCFSAKPFGVYGLLYSLVGVALVKVIVSSSFTNKLIGYSTLEQLKDVAQPFLFSGISALIVLMILHFSENILTNNTLLMVIGITIFGLIYLSLGIVFKNHILIQSITWVKAKLKR